MMFGLFIVFCGTTHFVSMFRKWFPDPSMIASTIAKFLTALVSFATAFTLITVIPLALTFPSRETLEKEVKVSSGLLQVPRFDEPRLPRLHSSQPNRAPSNQSTPY